MAVLGHVHFTAAWLLSLVQAAIGLAVAFGAPLSHAETQAIVEVVIAMGAALPIGGAVVAHGALVAGASAPAPTPTMGATN